jgi:hypothetical protein
MSEFFTDPLVPYETQRDNFNLDQTPNRNNQCMIESFAHLARYAGQILNDRAFDRITAYSYLHNIEKVNLRKPGEDRFHGLLHIRYLNFVFQGRLEFERVTFSNQQIRDYIQKYKAPVVVGFWIGHLLRNATSHISPVVGGSNSIPKTLILQDPYGDPNTNYGNHNGELVRVTDDFLKKMLVNGFEYERNGRKHRYTSYSYIIKEECFK